MHLFLIIFSTSIYTLRLRTYKGKEQEKHRWLKLEKFDDKQWHFGELFFCVIL